jgi:hypothetical protein
LLYQLSYVGAERAKITFDEVTSKEEEVEALKG